MSKPRAKARKPPAWMAELELKAQLCWWLMAAQSRYESAAIARFRAKFSTTQIRRAIRELSEEKRVTLLEVDRVKWAITVSGRNFARQVRERAERAAAA